MTAWIKQGLGLCLAASLMAASVAPASADYYYRGGPGPGVGVGIAAGIIGLGILGAAAAERDRAYYGAYCHPGPLECRTFEEPCFRNEYGDRICPAPERRCFRREFCD